MVFQGVFRTISMTMWKLNIEKCLVVEEVIIYPGGRIPTIISQDLNLGVGNHKHFFLNSQNADVRRVWPLSGYDISIYLDISIWPITLDNVYTSVVVFILSSDSWWNLNDVQLVSQKDNYSKSHSVGQSLRLDVFLFCLLWKQPGFITLKVQNKYKDVTHLSSN